MDLEPLLCQVTVGFDYPARMDEDLVRSQTFQAKSPGEAEKFQRISTQEEMEKDQSEFI